MPSASALTTHSRGTRCQAAPATGPSIPTLEIIMKRYLVTHSFNSFAYTSMLIGFSCGSVFSIFGAIFLLFSGDFVGAIKCMILGPLGAGLMFGIYAGIGYFPYKWLMQWMPTLAEVEIAVESIEK